MTRKATLPTIETAEPTVETNAAPETLEALDAPITPENLQGLKTLLRELADSSEQMAAQGDAICALHRAMALEHLRHKALVPAGTNAREWVRQQESRADAQLALSDALDAYHRGYRANATRARAVAARL